jgi:hypothetical protein
MSHIDIPVKDSDEVVEVSIDELPEQASDIVYILREEESTRDLYLRFAVCPALGYVMTSSNIFIFTLDDVILSE